EPGDVALVDLAAREGALERGVGGRVLGDHEQTGGVEVEAMDRGCAGPARAEARDDGVMQTGVPAGNREQAARFVDHDQPAILEDDARLFAGDRRGARLEHGGERQAVELERQQRAALAAARWVELPGSAATARRWRTPPQLGERERHEAEAI